MSSQICPLVEVPDGVQLTLKVTPRSRRNQVVGPVEIGGDRRALSVRLAAPPVDGAANDALCRFLADALGVSRSSVTLRSGETSRIKLIHIAGDPPTIAARLTRLCDG
jgi:uncharacterized protein (TIGR00251 family)